MNSIDLERRDPGARRRAAIGSGILALAGLLIGALLVNAAPGAPKTARAAETPAFRRIAYRLEMPRPASHLFHVTIEIETPAGAVPASVDLQIPRWQPGRYSVADFASNVQEFSARAANAPLEFEKTDDQTWRVLTRGSRTFTVAYMVFGNDLSGTFAQLDVTHGAYTGGEIFMYVAGHKQDAVDLHVEAPGGWRVINGRTDTLDQADWKFDNYELLIDNPTEVGPDWTLDTFTVDAKTYRVVVHSRASEGGRRPDLVRNIEKVVRAEVAMWGPPDFDRYTFMIHYAADGESWDGMEHLVSTQIIEPGALSDNGGFEDTVATAAHEFFHVWNVKRLRPEALGPWDWTRPANSKSLWIAEGLTNYYGHAMMRRAGVWDDGRLLEEFSDVIGEVENAAGSKLMSAVDASLAAPFIDSAAHKQKTNLDNTSMTYYFRGETIGLVLDLLIRGRSHGQRSLDDVLKRMYDEFYVKSPNATYYLKGRGYTDDDFVRVLSEVYGADMKDFYARHIRGVEPLPYDEALGLAGLHLVKRPARGGFTGGIVIDNEAKNRQALTLGALVTDSAAERAGLQQGDVLLAIGGTTVNRNNWKATLNRNAPGVKFPVEIQRFRRNLTLTLELGQAESFDYSIEDAPAVLPEARELRQAWLSGQHK